ncbi:MAG: DUF4249 family protein [Bacteroidales bacterium]|nr:DUF4249 family protein [Bacteroidales bacterium]
MRKTIILLMSLVCVACKVDFDFSDLSSEPILCLDMNLEYDPTEYEGGVIPDDAPLYLSGFIYAIPSAAGEREFPEDLYCTLDVYHNSELAYTWDGIRLDKFAGLVSADIRDLVPGDEIKVIAQAEGFPTATSTIIVPQRPPQVSISHSRINDKAFRISFTIEDDPDTEDSYAFTFHRASIYGSGFGIDPVRGSPLTLAFGNDNETSYLDLGPFDIIWEDGVKFYGVSDRSFNGQKKTFDVNVEYELPYGEDAENYAYYRIGIHRYTPERVKYEIARRDKSSNILGFIGLSPATFAYTNVIGGTGCISSSNVATTEWILVPPLE